MCKIQNEGGPCSPVIDDRSGGGRSVTLILGGACPPWAGGFCLLCELRRDRARFSVSRRRPAQSARTHSNEARLRGSRAGLRVRRASRAGKKRMGAAVAAKWLRPEEELSLQNGPRWNSKQCVRNTQTIAARIREAREERARKYRRAAATLRPVLRPFRTIILTDLG